MKILIGTPVHESKDYAMDRWMASVSKFTYPFDLLLVDNSQGLSYVKKVEGYCEKLKIQNSKFKITHIDLPPDAIPDERLAQSREIIRQEVLQNRYDAWLSLECDVITPPDTLTKLVDLIDGYEMVSHGYPARENPNGYNAELGIVLVKREVLEKYGFLKGYGYVDPVIPDSWYGSDVWFLRRIDREMGKHTNVYGKIKPIYHLAK